jgi:hypothetical protein
MRRNKIRSNNKHELLQWLEPPQLDAQDGDDRGDARRVRPTPDEIVPRDALNPDR